MHVWLINLFIYLLEFRFVFFSLNASHVHCSVKCTKWTFMGSIKCFSIDCTYGSSIKQSRIFIFKAIYIERDGRQDVKF